MITQQPAELWYALHVRSHCEKVVQAALQARGYAEYLPLYRKLSRWSDRMRQLVVPLFPGYVFCRFDINHRLPVLTIPGVAHIVGNGTRAEPIEDEELHGIKRMVASGFPITASPLIRAGQIVVVERGPLSGLEGLLLRIKGRDKLTVSLTLLQRSVAVEIDRSDVRAIPSFSKRATLPTLARSAGAGCGAQSESGVVFPDY